MANKAFTTLGVAGALLLPALSIAALTIPNTFKAGDVISSSQVNSNFTAVKTEADALGARLAKLEAPMTWVAPTLTNGWVNYNSLNGNTTFTDAGYGKDALGFVHLKGLISNTVAEDTAIFTLPAGYRPAKTTIVVIFTSDGVGRRANISAAGVVDLTGAPTDTANPWVSLDSVTFQAGG